MKPPAQRCPGRRRSVPSGQWHAAGDPHDLGWARAWAAPLSLSPLVAVRSKPVLKAFSQRRCTAGKAKKGALTACMRKLLPILMPGARTRSLGKDRRCQAQNIQGSLDNQDSCYAPCLAAAFGRA